MSRSYVVLKNVWPDNIGNAFVDIGAWCVLQKVLGTDCRLHSVSVYPVHLFAFGPEGLSRLRLDNLASRLLVPSLRRLLGERYVSLRERHIRRTRFRESSSIRNAFNLPALLKADYAVIAGKALTASFLHLSRRILDELKANRTKLIFLGVGGSYSKDELAAVKRRVRDLRPYILVSRDDIAFEQFKGFSEYSHNGLDCAFFVNEFTAFQGLHLESDSYVTLCFDRIPEPDLRLPDRLRVVRTSHYYDARHSYGRNPRERFRRLSMLVSDSPIDYLTVYRQTTGTHSDRNHACVATLCFGNPAKLYGPLAAVPLFSKIGAGDITRELVHPDLRRIQSEKDELVSFLSSVLG